VRSLWVSLVFLWATFARADGLPPVIHRIETGNRPERCVVPGQSISIIGSHLHVCLPDRRCRHDDVSVEFADHFWRERVFEASANRVVVSVPDDLPPGERTIRLRTGERQVTYTIEVLHSPVPQGARDFTWRIRELVLRDDGRGFEVSGVVGDGAPDGFSLLVTLDRVDEWWSARESTTLLAETVAVVTSGTFRGAFGPYRGKIPHGEYRVTARFELAKQPPALLVPFVAQLRPGRWRGLQEVRCQATRSGGAGAPRVRDHRRAHLAAIDGLSRVLDRRRAAFVLDRLVSGRRIFDASAFAGWVERSFLPELVAVVHRDRDFCEGWAFTTIERDTLAELTYAGLRDLCARAGVPVRELQLAPIAWSRDAFEAERERVRDSLRR
jgi:hypothetical protein